MTVGPMIGRLDAAFSASTASMPEAERTIVQAYIDRTIGGAIAAVGRLMWMGIGRVLPLLPDVGRRQFWT